MQNNRQQILQWAKSDLFDNENINQVIQIAEAEPTPSDWISFLKTTLLWSAMLLICSGVIFFFAYNWQEISRFSKFALVEAVMLFTTLAYIRFASTTLKTVTLISMSLFTGALLALVGQTYQTGADPWQLFATWSLLILPWAIISRASSLWVLWAALVNLSVLLYLEISDDIFGIALNEDVGLWIVVLLNTTLLCVFETFTLLNKPATANRYFNQLLVLIAGTTTTVLAIWAIFERTMGVAGFIYYAVWITSAYYVYRYKRPDLFIISMGSLSVIVILVSLLIKVIDHSIDDGGFLLVSFAIIGLSTLAGIWLKLLSQQLLQEPNNTDSNSSTTARVEAP